MQFPVILWQAEEGVMWHVWLYEENLVLSLSQLQLINFKRLWLVNAVALQGGRMGFVGPCFAPKES